MWIKTVRSGFWVVKVLAELAWALITLPFHRLLAVRAFRRALRRRGLSRREIARLTAVYKDSALNLKDAMQLFRSLS